MATTVFIAIVPTWLPLNTMGNVVVDPLTNVGWSHTWRTIEVQADSGRPTRIQGLFGSCNDDYRPVVSATATHGTVSTKDGVGHACGKTRPVTEVWYQSEPRFHGVDTVDIGAPFWLELNITVR
jgi:hypothetical protein